MKCSELVSARLQHYQIILHPINATQYYNIKSMQAFFYTHTHTAQQNNKRYKQEVKLKLQEKHQVFFWTGF